MKSIIKSIIVLLSLAAATVVNAQTMPVSYSDVAVVTGLQPLYQQPLQQNCNQVQPQQRSNVGAIIGGIAGALIASRVGNGAGKLAATAAGGALGSITGDRIDNRDNNQQYPSNQNCGEAQPQLIGYLVTYVYQGRQGTTRLSYNPGASVHVNVTVNAQ